jgi:hypothetical protein
MCSFDDKGNFCILNNINYEIWNAKTLIMKETIDKIEEKQ